MEEEEVEDISSIETKERNDHENVDDDSLEEAIRREDTFQRANITMEDQGLIIHVKP